MSQPVSKVILVVSSGMELKATMLQRFAPNLGVSLK